jgi:hypothetical protein
LAAVVGAVQIMELVPLGVLGVEALVVVEPPVPVRLGRVIEAELLVGMAMVIVLRAGAAARAQWVLWMAVMDCRG